jgi:hypothetical protein
LNAHKIDFCEEKEAMGMNMGAHLVL